VIGAGAQVRGIGGPGGNSCGNSGWGFTERPSSGQRLERTVDPINHHFRPSLLPVITPDAWEDLGEVVKGKR